MRVHSAQRDQDINKEYNLTHVRENEWNDRTMNTNDVIGVANEARHRAHELTHPQLVEDDQNQSPKSSGHQQETHHKSSGGTGACQSVSTSCSDGQRGGHHHCKTCGRSAERLHPPPSCASCACCSCCCCRRCCCCCCCHVLPVHHDGAMQRILSNHRPPTASGSSGVSVQYKASALLHGRTTTNLDSGGTSPCPLCK